MRVLEGSLAERMALRAELGTDVSSAEGRDDVGHRHVLVHHLNAVLRRLLGQRHDRGVARMAHHRDAGGLCGDRLAQLLHHLLDRPAGEDVFDVGAGVRGRLLGAVVDDGAEGVAFRPADEEAELHVLAPVLAQRLRVRCRRLRGQRHGERKAGGQSSQSHRHPPVFVGIVPAAAGWSGTNSVPPRHSLR